MRAGRLHGVFILVGCTAQSVAVPAIEHVRPDAPHRDRQTQAHDDATPMPAPPHGPPAAGRIADNGECERCHPTIAAEWRASQHRSSYSDAEFARAFRRERLPFCQGCHAPEADPNDAVPDDAAAIGVGCVTCHAPHDSDGRVLARAASGRADHDVRASAAFADVAGCASCHEFSFFSQRELAMQSTVSEHAASRFADASCGDCHMPEVGEGEQRHRSHAFAASRDVDMLRAAVVVSADRRPDGRVHIRLAPGEVGHAFPTGDLFRRLLVDAEGFDADGDPIEYDMRVLARHFGDVRHSQGPRQRTLVRDDRVGAAALAAANGIVDVELDLGPAAASLDVQWRVVHQRVDFVLPDEDAVVAGETVVASGALPRQENER